MKRLGDTNRSDLLPSCVTVFLLLLAWSGSVSAENETGLAAGNHDHQNTEHESRPGIMVWRLEAKTGVSEKDIDSLSSYLMAEVEKYSGRQVVSYQDTELVLRTEEKRQQVGMECDDKCLAEIGHAYGVPEAIAGDLGRVGDVWILNIRRVKLRGVGVLKRASRQVKGKTIGAMVDTLPGAVAELFGKKDMRTYRVAAYSTFFPGLALVALGGIGTWQMKDAWDEYKKSGDSAAADRHKAWKGVSTTCYIVGGAAMATGITLWVLEAVEKTEPRSTPRESPDVSFLFVPVENGVTVGIGGRW